MRQQMMRSVSPGQAAYVLDRLIAEGRTSPAEVRNYLADLPREIASLENRIAQLRDASPAGRTPTRNVARRATTARSTRGRRKRPSGNGADAQRLHGSYLGYSRQIPESERPRYAELRRKKGIEAAIKAMKQALGK